MFKKDFQQGRSEREAVARCVSGATGTQDVEALTGTHCMASCNG